MAIKKTLPVGNTGVEAEYHAIKGAVKARISKNHVIFYVHVDQYKDVQTRVDNGTPIRAGYVKRITATPEQAAQFLALMYDILGTDPEFAGGQKMDPEPFVEEVIEEPGDGQEGGQGEEDPGDGVYPDGET